METAVHELACHHCGAVYRRVALGPGESARCTRCDSVLESYSRFSAGEWLAIILSALIVFALANAYPEVTLFVQGKGQEASLIDAVRVTWESGYPEVAVMTFAAGFMLPLVHLCLLLWILGAMAFGRLPLFFAGCLRLLDALTPWCMVPVFLMGVLVAVVKLAGLASLVPGVGLFATAALAVLITMLTGLNSHKLLCMAHDLGLDAPVEKAPSPPSPALFSRTWALILGACIMYLPANLLPIMEIASIGGASAHTILGGVIELWGMGSWDIALVVFIASVAVPIFKIVALSVLVYMAQVRSPSQLKQRTQMYKVVEFIGQWSMLDVFVVILLSALGQFGNLLTIKPSGGAAAFGCVVILTMLAAMGFDPRLAWRRAGHRRHLPAQRANITPG
ncbi:MAG: paraquat-inducible protein A [Burkholderiaceae bacterium]|nr:paraquat-inducible protein A [Burkholderiaceae bacterium]